jgi:poly-gamma-glutamate system protein
MAVFAMGLVALVELWPLTVSLDDHDQMLRAARRTDTGFKAIRHQRQQLGHRMLKVHDPAATGMLGPSMSAVTTLPGHLDAKQTSVNPNFAAVVVKYLLALGAQPSDRVAVGCTGSFPALNIAVLAAAETLQLQVVMVSSAASSQFGANHPEFMWPDMERLLASRGILESRSTCVSLGGFRDNAEGMTDETRAGLAQAVARSGIALIQPSENENSLDARLKKYAANAPLSEFVAYINVGGGFLSVGGTKGNDQLGGGLIYHSNVTQTDAIDSVAHRFLSAGVPLINMVDVVRLAKLHGLPVAPRQPIAIGTGKVYQSARYRRTFSLLAILLIVSQVYLVMRPPVWWTSYYHWLPLRSAKASEPSFMV